MKVSGGKLLVCRLTAGDVVDPVSTASLLHVAAGTSGDAGRIAALLRHCGAATAAVDAVGGGRTRYRRRGVCAYV